MVAEIPGGVSKTALGVAMIRAEESRRVDRLFDDPYADAFLRAAPGVFAAEQRAADQPDSDVAAWGAAFGRTRSSELGSSMTGCSLLRVAVSARSYS